MHIVPNLTIVCQHTAFLLCFMNCWFSVAVGPIALGQYVFPFCKQLPRDLPGRIFKITWKANELQQRYNLRESNCAILTLSCQDFFILLSLLSPCLLTDLDPLTLSFVVLDKFMRNGFEFSLEFHCIAEECCCRVVAMLICIYYVSLDIQLPFLFWPKPV